MRAPILNDEEFTAALAFTASMERPQTYRLMLQLSIKLGLRPMELAGMESTWFRGSELRIPLGHSKRKSGRSLPVTAEILEAVAAYMEGRTGRVFLNASGEPFDARGISEAIRRVYRRAGMSASCYSGRRSLATNLVDRGVNILVVQKVLGHSNPMTTLQYVGVTDTMMRRAMFGTA